MRSPIDLNFHQALENHVMARHTRGRSEKKSDDFPNKWGIFQFALDQVSSGGHSVVHSTAAHIR